MRLAILSSALTNRPEQVGVGRHVQQGCLDGTTAIPAARLANKEGRSQGSRTDLASIAATCLRGWSAARAWVACARYLHHRATAV
jgi:hypothetical protein